MKSKAEKILFLLLVVCNSCSSIYKFSIDIQEPASITLPVSAQNILILDNAVTQSENNVIEQTLNGQQVSANLLSLDSMVWSAIDEIAVVLNESNFFNTISIYREPLRTDTEWILRRDLSPEKQTDFYNTENYDALLAVDRLLFSVKENVSSITPDQSSIPITTIQADGIITCSLYYYGREKPLSTYTVSDSVYSQSMIFNDSVSIFKTIPELVLNELSAILGNQAAKRFIPNWKTVERVFFVSYNSRMQEAASYAANSKWEVAESIWNTELGKKNKAFDKAKITFNLAVANEMQDNLKQALVWAEKAKEFFNNTDKENNFQEIELTDKYISELSRRIQNNRLLDFQWGKE